MRVILASASPRRREILSQLGIEFEVLACNTDETSGLTDAAELCEELSHRKAVAAKKWLTEAGNYDENTLIIGCDTVVCKDNKILGKPKNRDDTFAMLRLLSGKSHTVISGITLICGDNTVTDHEETTVTFDDISNEEICSYILTGEPDDKAGAYAIQGRAARWIRGINGCYFNVVGLPVHLLLCMARKLGIEL